ncbi:MAG: site-specific integrase [Holophagaceae bacterium]|nr:site-specific integrase [Holophagaceae bacterium]
MPRTLKSAKLDSKTARTRVDAGKRVQEPITEIPGRYLTYRPKRGGGVWGAYWVNPENSKDRKLTPLGIADDERPSNGSTILTYAEALKKAVDLFQQIEMLKADGESIVETIVTVKDAVQYYLAQKTRPGAKGAKSLYNIKKLLEAIVIPTLGEVEIKRLTRKKLEDWLDAQATTPRRVKTKFGQQQAFAPSPTTDEQKRARLVSANNYLTYVKAALTLCYDHQRIKCFPVWQQVKRYRGVTRARTRFLDKNEAVRLVNACHPDFRKLVKAALLTGCRYSELTKLRCQDFTASPSTVFIRDPKNGKPRHVALTLEGKSLFEELTLSKNPADLIFTNSIKRRVDATKNGIWVKGDQDRFMQLAVKAGGIEPRVTFHELRHTYASMLINRGCPLAVVAEQLGHTGTAMVERHYGHLAPSYVADAVKAAMPHLGILDSDATKVQMLKISAS